MTCNAQAQTESNRGMVVTVMRYVVEWSNITLFFYYLSENAFLFSRPLAALVRDAESA